MTVIALKDGELATDSGQFDDDIFVGTTVKISFDGKGAFAAATGLARACERFRAWFSSGARAPFDPKAENGFFAALILEADGTVLRLDSDGGAAEVNDVFHAIGAGREIAIGAMAAGASASCAVQIACERSVYCRGPVQVASVRSDAAAP